MKVDMNLTDKIFKKVQALPAEKQAEILDFVDFLEEKLAREDTQDWSAFSLASAMRGLEDEDDLYSEDDLKVRFRD